MLPLLLVTVGCEWWEEFEVDVGWVSDLCCPSFRFQLVVVVFAELVGDGVLGEVVNTSS